MGQKIQLLAIVPRRLRLNSHPGTLFLTLTAVIFSRINLLGLDHEALTFYHNGIQRRLTDVHGRVIQEILA